MRSLAEVVRRLLRGPELGGIGREIDRRHDESLRRLHDWIAEPTIVVQSLGTDTGIELMRELARDAGFQTAERISTDGVPALFATLDAGARTSVGVYFMYDVKHADPSEWSSPPFDAALVAKEGVGTVVVGRGAMNQKGPEAAFLAALHAIRGAGVRLPVNLVLVAEGEEEVGSPHFRQVLSRPSVRSALEKCVGVFMPWPAQDPDGTVTVALGAKGVVELELVASGESWGRGPRKDVHSSNRARLDSPAFHLVQALATLVTGDGDPAIAGFADAARPPTPAERDMLDVAAGRIDERSSKGSLEADRWIHDFPWRESLERFLFDPTVNIQGLVGGYTGPGTKTVLPHRVVAKLDLRLVPDMTLDGAVEALRAHLAANGFGDIEMNVAGGYDPTTTSQEAAVVRAALDVYQRAGGDPILLPRIAASYPGCVFTGPPLRSPSVHFGLGHGGGAHAPDEYLVIEPADERVASWDGSIAAYVAYLFALATA